MMLSKKRKMHFMHRLCMAWGLIVMRSSPHPTDPTHHVVHGHRCTSLTVLALLAMSFSFVLFIDGTLCPQQSACTLNNCDCCQRRKSVHNVV